MHTVYVIKVVSMQSDRFQYAHKCRRHVLFNSVAVLLQQLLTLLIFLLAFLISSLQ
jgi:hypothetical protein